ncbi:hypothetical protein DN752_22815 [Echinicola strongylocentroti]|uniref:Anti-sigma factor n=1 Tax=Echinicola strongylocentroti TaxID=1795355 RepID=A0A2Z4IPC0_9BACT|nr:FecR family protein [Echinicola strongylocentroti]AWW32745.1 hypothetical protein DN752_22815 [Echinicola strongylocentroti]
MNQLLEFLTNPEFVRWVRHSDKDLDVYWSTWIKANPNRVEDLKMAREIILGIHVQQKKLNPNLKEEVLSNVLQEEDRYIPTKEAVQVGERKSRWNKLRMGQYYRVAAIISISLVLAIIYGILSIRETPDHLATNHEIKKTVGSGEKAHFLLADGTEVWLNSESELVYSTFDYGEDRKVYLKGEGFFDVAHDPDKPFRVYSSELVTTALGTTFNISNYHSKPIRVALLSGKVEVANLSSESINSLAPGQELVHSLIDEQTTIRRTGTRNVTGWKDGVLVFENEGFKEVMDVIKRWYGVEIIVEGTPRRQWTIDIAFDNASLERVLSRIAYIEKFQYDIKGKTVTIKL